MKRQRNPGAAVVFCTRQRRPQAPHPLDFEPIHGSAFDITGKGIANPVVSFWTTAMMPEHLGEGEALMTAVEQVCAACALIPDLGGKATTKEVTRAICEAIAGANVHRRSPDGSPA